MHKVAPGWRDHIFTVNHVILIWGISGEGVVVVEDKPYALGPEQLAVYFPGMQQQIHASDAGWEYCWWTADGPLAATVASAFGLVPGVRDAGPPPLKLITEMVKLITKPDFSAEMAASCLVYDLFAQAASVAALIPVTDGDDGMIAAARDRLHANWADPSCNVEVVAKDLGVHRSTLSRRFKSDTGTTVIEYLTSVRVQNAMNMLQHTTLPIATIAERCGFTDNAYFCRVFRQRLGTTPRAFRNRRVGTW